jgi:predicted Zn-dependent peptidase
VTLAAEQKPGTTRTLIEGVRRTVLRGGLRVVTEHVPGVRSAAIGVFVGVGSRDESAALNGASHFLEHLLFKGTETRSAMDISSALDGVGGEFNAYTAREYTCYHARVLDEDLPLAVDVLGDMMTASLIAPEDVEAEREVILDEIAMHDDDPDDVVHNLFAAQAWHGSPLSRPIAGTTESIQALTRTQVNRYYRSRYVAPAMTVAVAGNIVHADVVRLVRKAFSRRDFLADLDARPLPPRLAERPRSTRSGDVHATRGFEQVNQVLGMRGMTRSDDRRYALGVLNAAFGGGSSSRLFQEVREHRGLAYSVYSFATSYSDAGMVGVSVGSLPGKSDEVLDVVRAELSRVVRTGLTQEELDRGRGQMRGGLVLSLEDTGSRMTRLGEVELFQRRLLSLDEVLTRLDAVTLDDVNSLAADLFSRPETLAVVGPGTGRLAAP